MTQQMSITQSGISQISKNLITEYFKQIVRDSGIKLVSTDDPNGLTQEQALVVRDIEKFIQEDDDNVEKFIRGFKVLIRKEKYLKKALLPTVFRKKTSGDSTDDIAAMEIQQESLFRIFLKVSPLQPPIIDILLNEVTSTIDDEAHDPAHLRLVLSQLRYLPHIKTPESLTTKLLDIIEIAPYTAQLEILDSIPEIIPDSEYHSAVEELAKMLDNSDNLSGAIIDCLNALNLTSDMRTQIQDHILAKMLAGSSMKIFPVFLDFLLTDCHSRTLPGILMKIRNALNAIMSRDEGDKETESCKILIFNRLQKSASLKVVSETWLSLISNMKNSNDHKYIDLVLLFMLHASTKLKKRTIETTIRKKVKEGHFKSGLVEHLFEKNFPQQLFRDYFNTMTEIGSTLLRTSTDSTITEFASTLFKLLFTHEHTIRIYRQEILENLIVLVGSSDQKNVTVILNIILDLVPEISKTPNHAIILMRLLEILDTFELKDTKLVFEILCSVTCSDDSLIGLREEIHILIRKQLSSFVRSLKHRGIISAVVMAKHIATVNGDQSDVVLSEDSIISIAQLNGVAKDAAALLELANTSTAGSPDLVGLYYDQLAAMIVKSENLDKHFLAWLHENVTLDFQDVFITETTNSIIDDLEVSRQYNLNTDEEMEAPISVNIAELTLKPDKHSIVVLAPHFRLLRLLHYKQQNGNLESIDALLGCGVILPKSEQKDSLEQFRKTSDCLFHCINWFREVISGFVLQKSEKLRRKVLQRIDHLTELEQLLFESLDSIPDHKLPNCYFDLLSQSTRSSSPSKDLKQPRKKLKKSREFLDSTVASSSKTPTRKKRDDFKVNFREIDTDLVILLKYPLGTTNDNQICLSLKQLNFILKDYVRKLSLLTKGANLGMSHLTAITPLQVITDSVKTLPHIRRHFDTIITHYDDDDAKIAFGLILECLCLILGWSGWQHSKRLELFKNILKSFRSSDTDLHSANHLITELTERLANLTQYCSCLTHAVHLIQTMEALDSITPSPTIRSKTASKLLSKEWENHSSANIDILLKSYLSSANIKTLCGIVGTLQEQAPSLTSKNDSLDMLKSVTKTNFHVFYRNLWMCLHDRVKNEIQSLTNAQHLTLWRTVALTMQGLMTIVKVHETKFNLVCFLKKSIAILKIFLSHGIPILEIELKSKPDKVVEILKTIQSNTRFLHHLCCYSKLTKDVSLMSYVPQFRLTLETLVYRVKAALVANGCSAAFWMGNLKNRDLQGEDILTQSTENSTHDDEEEEEELPSDDDDLDDKSASEVFE
ncbi:Fanconi anemia group D2 protein [Tribolium madens]|uniref:Fanconi anemia group D2 protein n=1 Tax=Tribolium madens TaxID=41895 RepID=UPI001CF722B0|nr:Fanconi anemia group D2 protein [Tribolium madens]